MKWHSCSQSCTTDAAFFFFLPTWLSCAMLLQPRPKVMYSKYDKHLSYALALNMSFVHFTLFWPKKGVLFLKTFFHVNQRFFSANATMYTCCQNVWHGWPVFEVKCLCSRGQEWGRESCHSISFSIFDSYDMKCLWFKFG